LKTGPAIIATRVLRRLWANIGKHWGVYVMAIRWFRGAGLQNGRFRAHGRRPPPRFPRKRAGRSDRLRSQQSDLTAFEQAGFGAR